MSSRCQCPFSGPAGTILGCHRDPITSEKGWLDFAVRELSRVAAGKARGQEAVWRSQCKPVWWDCVCNYPWKNPTANPKDSKDTLKVKFECLVQHLRKEGQLPREMEEEISLWEAGRVSEVFLMTSFSSLLGQASNLHTVLLDACHKMEGTGISVTTSILTDLKSCLSACTDKIEAIKNMTELRNQKGTNSKPASCAGNKRLCDETDSEVLSQPPCKRLKYSTLMSPPLSSSSPSRSPNLVSPTPSISSSTPPSPSSSCLTLSQSVSDSNISVSAEQSKQLLAVLQKQLLQKKVTAPAVAAPVCQTSKTQTQVNPKAHSIHSTRKQSVKKTRVPGVGQGNVATTDIVSVSEPSSSCLSAAIPPVSAPDVMVENTEFTDFLELDLAGNDDVTDCQFLDRLLQETSPGISINCDTMALISSSVAQPVKCQTPPNINASPVQNEKTNPFKSDPLFGSSFKVCNMPDNTPFLFDLEPDTVADRQNECGGTEEGNGPAMFPGVGDISTTVQETEVVSDSGYSSESSVTTSHRGSLDSDSYCYLDLNSPDLEAYLDSLES